MWFSSVSLCAKSLSPVWLFATPWTVAHQAPLSMGFLQARILQWVAISSSRGSFSLRNRTRVSCVSCIAGRLFTHWAIREAHACLAPSNSACPPEMHREGGETGTLGLFSLSVFHHPVVMHAFSLLVLTLLSSRKHSQSKTRSWRPSCGYFSFARKGFQDTSQRRWGSKHARYEYPQI